MSLEVSMGEDPAVPGLLVVGERCLSLMPRIWFPRKGFER